MERSEQDPRYFSAKVELLMRNSLVITSLADVPQSINYFRVVDLRSNKRDVLENLSGFEVRDVVEGSH